ncbi:hypothetical protein [Streptomyces sp. DSM 40750]|uniref:hypothetical protein n=1 Tax=Streptomyces sp. DSM 40750 TaxID=2801030 RepID=UPI00214B2783|nr:hypothetical protein [Streptomyces sp. DSM 40750]UUU22649.1 hypothetical protein JIX55_21435 [Streptomyces sp. DSM 40750]
MSVITTPAPRLPVRSGYTPQAVSPMLSRLAAERATGVLLRESGSLYLSEGEVVHAESPRSPGLDVLLTTGGILDGDGWREAVDTAGAGLRVGRFLVDSGRVARGALELCHAGALFDAAYFVLGPSGAPASFRYGAAHWLGPIRPVPVATVEREARRRRDLLHRIWPDPATDDAPLIRAAALDVPPVPARQGAVLGQVNGFRTAAEISLALGRPAFHTLVDVRRLAAAGLISTARHSPPGTPPMPARPGHAPPTGPGRDPSAEPPVGDGASPPTPPWPLTTTDPDVALLQRLRDALEAL